MGNRKAAIYSEPQNGDSIGPTRPVTSADVIVDGNGNAISTGNVTLFNGTTMIYDTITEALANAVAGDVVSVSPGTYDEKITIPASVTVTGTGGKERTVISSSDASGHRVIMSNSSVLENFTVHLPTDASAAIYASGVVGAGCRQLRFIGHGGSGIGWLTDGSSFTLASLTDFVYSSGDCDAFIKLDNTNTLTSLSANVGVVVTGTMNDAIKLVNGDFTSQNVSIRSTGVTDAIDIISGSCSLFTYKIENAATGAHLCDDAAELNMLGSQLFPTVTEHIAIDEGITGSICHFSSGEMDRSRINIPYNMDDAILTFQDERTGDKGFMIIGELAVGRPESGQESVFGEGDSYVRGMKVLTTDNTTGTGSDGGNLTNVSTAAASAAGSTFTFQGVTANHSILFCSALSGSDMLKHYGIKVSQTTAAVEVTPKSFAIEIWDGSAWVEVNSMATHSSLFYRYGNELFIRGNISEHIRFGITSNTTWATKTIDGTNAYWARIRITTDLTTAPVFQQFKLSCSRFEANADGTNTYHGNSRFRQTLSGNGNNLTSVTNATNFTIPVGSGGVPTGWSSVVSNGELKNNGNASGFHFILPRGIDTSLPMNVDLIYLPTVAGTDDVDMVLSFIPVERQGVDEADPAGGEVPVARTLANTETLVAKPAQSKSNLLTPASVTTKVQTVSFTGFDVSDYYEGDIVFLYVELNDDGVGNADIGIVALEIAGSLWTNGEKL